MKIEHLESPEADDSLGGHFSFLKILVDAHCTNLSNGFVPVASVIDTRP